MPKTVFSAITDTLTFLLNTLIAPPRSKGTKDVALVELPRSMCQRGTEAEAPELRRARSVLDLAAGDDACLGGEQSATAYLE